MPFLTGRAAPALAVSWACALMALAPTAPQAAAPAPAHGDVDFNRQILPILSDHCFTCHGPDQNQRKAKLRLDTKDGAFGELRDGGHAVVPGKLDESELIRRVTSTDADEVMPPTGKGKPLSPTQINLLKRWVEGGAAWSQHWAFVAPQRSALPPVSQPDWPRNAVDRFILARLDREG